jgi:hypothetical protein
MFKSRFLIGFLVFIIVAILLVAGGFAVYQLGYSQGYATSLAVSTAEEGVKLIPQQAFPHPGYYWYIGYGGFFRPLLLCFAIVAFLLALFTILKTIRFLTWRSMIASDPEKWHRHWRRYRHGPPGWYGYQESETQESESESPEDPKDA